MVEEPLCNAETPCLSLNLNKVTQCHLMKIEWLVAAIPAVKSPDKAERAAFRGDVVFESGSNFVV